MRCARKCCQGEGAEVGLRFAQTNYRRLQMNYNTETINSLAQQFAEMIKVAVVA